MLAIAVGVPTVTIAIVAAILIAMGIFKLVRGRKIKTARGKTCVLRVGEGRGGTHHDP